MKRVIYILFAVATLTGCSSWLSDPRPLGETEARDMFSTEEGFRNVLTGVYIKMSGEPLYGRNMSMVLPEMFAQHWNAENTTMENYAKNFNFESGALKDVIEDAWGEYFNCIVNLNSLLNEIDAKRELFNEANYNMIKGEALGLRAFLHFEALRFWGPVPVDANPAQTAIPYVEQVSRNSMELVSISYEQVLDKIMTDLNAAEELLKEDPITKFDRDILLNPGGNNTYIVKDDYYFYRQSRFNIYAVKATKARYYQWIGNKPEALKYAEQVINALVEDSGNKVFNLCTEGYLTDNSTERTLIPEHIFAIYKYNLSGTVKPLYEANGRLSQESGMVSELYENYADDIRFKGVSYWQDVVYAPTNKITHMFKKYITANYETASKYVPLIRLPEMHLIAMESAGSSEDAKRFFEPYREARNLYSGKTTNLVDDMSIRECAEKEYRKEFFGEGQMFYYYKRHKITSFTWPINVTMIPDNYVVPKPDAQIQFE